MLGTSIKQVEATWRKRVLAQLKACSSTKNLRRGKETHAEAIRNGLDSCTYVSSALVNMYAKCGSMVEARQVFDRLKDPDVVAWNALILGYAKNGKSDSALHMFGKMGAQGHAPNSRTFVAALKACSNLALAQNGSRRAECLERGKEIHSKANSLSDIYIENTLIDMYTKCGSMVHARQVFDGMKHRDVVSWTTLISGYVENGDAVTALDLFEKMRCQGCAPDSYTIVSALKACSSLLERDGRGKSQSLERVKLIHSEMNCDLDIYVQCTLIDVYAKCGSIADARQVFDCIKRPNVVAWNTLVLGYVENGESAAALDLFARMRSQGCSPNSITYVAALKACSALALEQDERGRAECRELGKRIHLEIGLHSDTYVQTSLMDMYSKCGSMAEARQIFDGMKQPDDVSWTTLILGYAELGDGATALDLFAKMKSRHVPTSRTFVAALKACASLAMNLNARAAALERGKQIHSEAADHLDAYVQNNLIDMYAKCGSVSDASQVFHSMQNPNIVSWNTLLLACAENGEAATALDLFSRMQTEGYAPNSVTYLAALKACTILAVQQDGYRRAECLELGKQIHSEIGCHLDVYVQSTLVDMYAKCGKMATAHQVFDGIKHPSVVSWTALILGYAENGEGVTALDLFSRMKSQGCEPSWITFVAAIKACGLLGALQTGSKLHAEMDACTRGYRNAMIVTCLVDFYAKCGDMLKARAIFDAHPQTRDLKTWTALLAGYSRLGDVGSVFELFRGMQDAGLQPDGVTFLCILTCCSHAGLIEKASEYFEAMSTRFGIAPTLEHHTCMVDILGRSNKLDDAMALLRRMPRRAGASTWMALLGACRKWSNAGIGTLALECLTRLDGSNAAAFVLMAHIYGSKGMWVEQEAMLRAQATLNRD